MHDDSFLAALQRAPRGRARSACRAARFGRRWALELSTGARAATAAVRVAPTWSVEAGRSRCSAGVSRFATYRLQLRPAIGFGGARARPLPARPRGLAPLPLAVAPGARGLDAVSAASFDGSRGCRRQPVERVADVLRDALQGRAQPGAQTEQLLDLALQLAYLAQALGAKRRSALLGFADDLEARLAASRSDCSRRSRRSSSAVVSSCSRRRNASTCRCSSLISVCIAFARALVASSSCWSCSCASVERATAARRRPGGSREARLVSGATRRSWREGTTQARWFLRPRPGPVPLGSCAIRLSHDA